MRGPRIYGVGPVHMTQITCEYQPGNGLASMGPMSSPLTKTRRCTGKLSTENMMNAASPGTKFVTR